MLIYIVTNSYFNNRGKEKFGINFFIEKGFIKVDNFRNSSNKIQYWYLLTLKGIEEKTKKLKV